MTDKNKKNPKDSASIDSSARPKDKSTQRDSDLLSEQTVERDFDLKKINLAKKIHFDSYGESSIFEESFKNRELQHSPSLGLKNVDLKEKIDFGSLSDSNLFQKISFEEQQYRKSEKIIERNMIIQKPNFFSENSNFSKKKNVKNEEDAGKKIFFDGDAGKNMFFDGYSKNPINYYNDSFEKEICEESKETKFPFDKLISDSFLTFEQKQSIRHYFDVFHGLKISSEVIFKFEHEIQKQNINHSKFKFFDSFFPLIIHKEPQQKIDNSQFFLQNRKFSLDLPKIFDFLPNLPYHAPSPSSKNYILEIGDFCVIEGELDLLEFLAPKIKVASLKNNQFIYNETHKIWIISPILQLPHHDKSLAMVKITFTLIKPQNFAENSNAYSLCKINEETKELTVVNSKKTADPLQNTIKIEGLLNHLCLIFVALPAASVCDVFNKNIENNILERTCDKVFDSQNMYNTNEIKNCIDSLYFRNEFDSCMTFILAECPPVFLKCTPKYLACLRLYTTSFYRSLNYDLRSFFDYKKWTKFLTKIKPFLNGMIWGLKEMEYFWGTVYRGIDVQDRTLGRNTYVKFQEFLSCSKKKVTHFMKKGFLKTLFVIKSKTGRCIEKISTQPHEEEVLFFPGTVFKITKVEQSGFFTSYDTVYMEEVCLPFGDRKVFWVDDEPENNKNLMIWQESNQKGASVFWRNSSKEALDVILNGGRYLMRLNFDNLRVITDMVRKEDGVTDLFAGAKLIKGLEGIGFNGEIAVFCGDKKNAEENCKSLGVDTDRVKFFTSKNQLRREFLFKE